MGSKLENRISEKRMENHISVRGGGCRLPRTLRGKLKECLREPAGGGGKGPVGLEVLEVGHCGESSNNI